MPFLQLLERVCRYPSMYTFESPFYEACAYLSGYIMASPESSLTGIELKGFKQFVCKRRGVAEKYAWPYALRCTTRNDEEALALLLQLMSEFCRALHSQPLESIIANARADAPTPEGEPETAIRGLLDAMLTGNREHAKTLLLAPDDAQRLCGNAYPTGIAEQLREIVRSEPISRVVKFCSDTEVTLLVPGLPSPVRVENTPWGWRVDGDTVVVTAAR